MLKLFSSIIFAFGIYLTSLFISPQPALALTCSVTGTYIAGGNMTINANPDSFKYKDQEYVIETLSFDTGAENTIAGANFIPNNTSFPLTIQVPSREPGEHQYIIFIRYKIPRAGALDSGECGTITINDTGGGTGAPSCSVSPRTMKSGDIATISGTGLASVTNYEALVNGNKIGTKTSESSGSVSISFVYKNSKPTETFTVELKNKTSGSKISCGTLTVSPLGIPVGANPCVDDTCKTGIGDIKTDDVRELASQVLRIATGVAGALALILMVIGAIRVLTSSGDQQKLSGGRDMLVGAIAGLLFLIFSIIILRFIGFDILGLA